MTNTIADAEPISKAVALLNKGNSLAVILGTLVRVPAAEVPALSKELPPAVAVTRKITDAVATLGLTNVGHQHLTVDERRSLAQTEIDILSEERDAIDVLEKYIKARRAAHKVMLYNHWDSEIEASDLADKTEIDSDGRFLTKVSSFAQGGARHFDRQMAEGKPFVTEAGLKDVADDGTVEGFDHEAYLACTTEVRVFDEAKTLIRMRTDSATIAALREAAQMGAASTSFYHRAS